MKSHYLMSLLVCILLSACGMDVVVDQLSPDGKYHVLVQRCTPLGSWTGQDLQVSLLPAGKEEGCNDMINSIAEFRVANDPDHLQIEWLSNARVRAWWPGFQKNACKSGGSCVMPDGYNWTENSPTQFVFKPR